MRDFGFGLELGARRRRSAAAWSPAQLTGLHTWLRPDADYVTLVGGVVSAWADRSGNGEAARNAVQPTAGLRPAYSATNAAYNNQPTIDFPTGQAIGTVDWAASLAQPYTLVCAFNPGSTGNTQVAIDSNDATLTRRTALSHNAGDHVQAYAGTLLATSATYDASPRIALVVYNDASSEVYVNDSATPAASGACGTSAVQGIAIGTLCDGSSFPLLGSIAEIVICAGALGATERGALFAYMGARYGKAWA